VSIPDIKALLKAGLPLFDRAWLLLMLHSGLRTCEIRRLKWESVDLERRTLRIEQSKGQKDRVVFLSPLAVDALKVLPRTSALVFTRYHRPLSRRYCQSRLKTLMQTCAVKATPHQLRHTAATLLLNAGSVGELAHLSEGIAQEVLCRDGVVLRHAAQAVGVG
jgi:integrase/recombinase XerD